MEFKDDPLKMAHTLTNTVLQHSNHICNLCYQRVILNDVAVWGHILSII